MRCARQKRNNFLGETNVVVSFLINVLELFQVICETQMSSVTNIARWWLAAKNINFSRARIKIIYLRLFYGASSLLQTQFQSLLSYIKRSWKAVLFRLKNSVAKFFLGIHTKLIFSREVSPSQWPLESWSAIFLARFYLTLNGGYAAGITERNKTFICANIFDHKEFVRPILE